MAVMKCKMCGGDLNVTEGLTVVECEYCGSRQTIPNQDSEKKLTLFARADRLRRACEFDKAAGVYEGIVAEFPEEAEAYWGLVLCRYGIEYVDDPATGKKVPTCHRSSFNSILEDEDFEDACDYADPIARRLYRDEAKTIERILERIRKVSEQEKPYDIFICYKETDENGERTIDSVIAQDVYDALVKKGYRVFFSRISLEDKLGEEYEPYIFAALNSTKIMLVIGTAFENFDAVWVKNEWSRFLALAQEDGEKVLIPCFKDIDAYDMPKVFQRLQAQDLSKVGALQDLLRGIDKIISSMGKDDDDDDDDDVDDDDESEFLVLLKRGNLALEEEEWQEAYDCFQDAVYESDSDQEYFPAYLGRLCAELGLNDVEVFRSGDPKVCEDQGRKKFECSAEMKAGYIMLGRSNWDQADSFFDQALEHNPECASAYVGKLMASCQVQQEEDIPEVFWGKGLDIAADKNFKRALRFADNNLKARLKDYQKRSAPEAAEEAEAGARKDLEEIRSRLSKYKGCILATGENTYALTEDGMVLAAGSNQKKQCNTGGWRDITAIAAGFYHVVGLKRDGTVVAAGAGDSFINRGQCETGKWSEIKSITTGGSWTIGVKPNGSIVVCGDAIHNKNDMSSGYLGGVLKNVVGQLILPNAVEYERVFASSEDFYGLKKDKTVEAYNTYDACRGWRGIIDIASSQRVPQIIGLRKDGRVVAYGKNEYGECEVGRWTNIVAAAVGGGGISRKTFTVGLRADGTVVAVGDNEHGQCKTAGWRDIVAIAAGESHTVGLRADGTVVAVGDNEYGQCNTSDWRDIVAIVAGKDHTVGLKADGTVVAIGDNEDGQCNTQGWSKVRPLDPEEAERRRQEAENRRLAEVKNKQKTLALASARIAVGRDLMAGVRVDGAVMAVGSYYKEGYSILPWTDVMAVAIGDEHVVGLRKDGTVVAAGKNKSRQCDVSGWTDIVAVAAGDEFTVGLKRNGTMEFTGVGPGTLLLKWTDIVSIAAHFNHVIGVRKDGTVLTSGLMTSGCRTIKLDDWKDITAVATNSDWTFGLRSDGTVVYKGQNGQNKDCQREVEKWRDIIAIAAGYTDVVGLKSDGTVVAYSHQYYKDKVCKWTNVVAIAAGTRMVIGLSRDGTLLHEGDGGDGRRYKEHGWKFFNNIDTLPQEIEDKRLHARIALESEQASLQIELANLKGLFSGKRRKEIEARLAQIETELKKL